MIYEKINLISEILDATLNLKCFYIKDLDNNLDYLKKLIPPIFTINQNYFTRFINSFINTKENHVYFIEDFVYGNYIIICLSKKEQSYLFIGPYLITNNHDNIFKDLKNYDISDVDLSYIKKYYISIPFISKSKITSIVSVIKNNIYDKNINLNFIYKSNLKKFDSIEDNPKNLSYEYLNYKFVEERFILEQKLLANVRAGSKVNSMKFLNKILDLYFIDSNVYSLRNCKNKLIYYNTLLSKTAQDNGVSNTYTENLFQMYLDKTESANSIHETKNIFSTMVIDYCFAISDFSVKHFSSLVGKVINYINSNLQNNLSVNEIANLFYISPTYLSRTFKKETGFSVIEYINELKIKHSKFLLRDTSLPIQDIGRIVGINDVNYFSRLFKKYMNQSPSEYRKGFK